MTEARLSGSPIELPRVALSLAKLALVGFSLALFGQMIWLHATQRASFALHNALGVQPRRVLLLAIGAGLVMPVAVTLTVSWFRRRRSDFVETLERTAGFCAPVAVSFLLPGLFLNQVAEAKPLFYLIVLLAFSIAFWLLLNRALELAPRLRWMPHWRLLTEHAAWRAVPFLLLFTCGAAYTYLFGHWAIVHHRLLETAATDLGNADNAMSNLLHGHFRRAGLHADYGALAFVPIYWLHPGAETLIWLQVATATLTVIPLYFLVAAQLSRAMGFWFGAAYLLSAPLQSALLGGFSWLPTVTLLTITSYYAWQKQRRWLMLSSLLLLLTLSDAGPLYALALGLFWVVSGKNARIGIGLSVLSSAFVVFNLTHSTRELAGAIGALVQNPVYFLLDFARAAKLTSALHALAPFCLLPLVEIVAWPLFIPALLFTSATNEFWPMTHGAYGSGLVWAPACLLASLFALERQRARLRGQTGYAAWIVTLTIAQLSHSYDFGALLRTDNSSAQASTSSHRMTPAAEARFGELMTLVRRIPIEASVASTNLLFSRVSNHPEAYLLTQAYGQPDYILIGKREVQDARSALETTFAMHGYRLLGTTAGEFYLFSRGPEDDETRRALRTLGFSGS